MRLNSSLFFDGNMFFFVGFTFHRRQFLAALQMPHQVGLNAICAERRRLGSKGASVLASRALLKCLEAALHSQSQESLLLMVQQQPEIWQTHSPVEVGKHHPSIYNGVGIHTRWWIIPDFWLPRFPVKIYTFGSTPWQLPHPHLATGG